MLKESILVTGGCGFIGTSLIAAVRATWPNLNIRVLDNLETGSEERLGKVAAFERKSSENCVGKEGVVLIKGDIRDRDTVIAASRGCACVIHLAGNTGVAPSVADPRVDMEYNVVGTFNVLEAARINRVRRFVFASSGAPAGQVTPPIHEELAPHPTSPYGASKLAGEGYCSAYFHTFGVGTVCLRFGNVYGPGSLHKSSVVAKFVRQALNDEVCEIFGDGEQTRDFIYIDDLVRAIMLAMHENVDGETFQIATGNERTVSEVAELVGNALERYGRNMRVLHGKFRTGDVRRNFSDTRKARRLLGWSAEIELQEGIERTVAYFLAGDTSW